MRKLVITINLLILVFLAGAFIYAAKLPKTNIIESNKTEIAKPGVQKELKSLMPSILFF